MDKKNIILAGYPKSGTTWASRLVAELVQCPLEGDWGFEGIHTSFKTTQHPDSNYSVYKSHHEYVDLPKASKKPIFRMIYILRDPRDVVVSGVHFFKFKSVTQKVINALKLDTWVSSEISEAKKKKQMIQAILHGNESLNSWFKTSWKKHQQGYEHTEVLRITYEALLANPEKECHRILEHLDLIRSEKHIRESIKRQSFKRAKALAQQQEDPFLKNIVRQGGTQYWKDTFTEKEKALFHTYLKNSHYENNLE